MKKITLLRGTVAQLKYAYPSGTEAFVIEYAKDLWGFGGIKESDISSDRNRIKIKTGPRWTGAKIIKAIQEQGGSKQ